MTATPIKLVPPPVADARAGVYHMFIRDLVLPCTIGVHRHERKRSQRVRVNLDLAVREGERPAADDIENVVCYEKIADGVRGIVAASQVNLLETLAESIAARCLDDARVRVVRVRVEKLDIFADAGGAGIEIERVSAEP